jgi:hypothetical protein
MPHMTEAEKIAGRIELILSYTARRDLLAWRAEQLHKPLTIERREQLETEFRGRLSLANTVILPAIGDGTIWGQLPPVVPAIRY